ncbi:hypothetical protein SAY86_003459 [Trapa natans]|uniref:Uncharacterized protein n=1 Tax=Trapa natans TaxID=22666 RepID=A0AAN7RGX9_TRANT|nr:hypothetical protein SAY86_003459 [Trapa natans]
MRVYWRGRKSCGPAWFTRWRPSCVAGAGGSDSGYGGVTSSMNYDVIFDIDLHGLDPTGAGDYCLVDNLVFLDDDRWRRRRRDHHLLLLLLG